MIDYKIAFSPYTYSSSMSTILCWFSLCSLPHLPYLLLDFLNSPRWQFVECLGNQACLFLHLFAAAAATLLQSCPTLCNHRHGSPPGSSIPGILQARTLEWVAISFSNAWKWKVKVKSLSHVRLLGTPWTAAYQAPPSMGFSRQEYWSGSPVPSLVCVCIYLNLHPFDCKEIKPLNPKGNQPGIVIGNTDAETEAPILWPRGAKSWLIRKDPDAGED